MVICCCAYHTLEMNESMVKPASDVKLFGGHVAGARPPESTTDGSVMS